MSKLFLRTFLGSLTNFLSCNSLLNLSLKVDGWCVSSWLTASLVKLAKGSNSSHVGSIGALLVDVELAPQLGGKGRLQWDSMFVPHSPPIPCHPLRLGRTAVRHVCSFPLLSAAVH